MKEIAKTPPKYLDKLARAEWVRMWPLLKEVSAGAIDMASVASYCQCYSYMRKAQSMVDEQGLIVMTPNGQQQINPWHSVFKQNAELIKKLAADLGFSVAARKRMGIEAEIKSSLKDLV